MAEPVKLVGYAWYRRSEWDEFVRTAARWLRKAASRVTGFQLFGVGLSWDRGESSSDARSRTSAGFSNSSRADEIEPLIERGHRQVLLAIARSREGCLDIDQAADRTRVGKLVSEHYLEVLESAGFVEDVDDGDFVLTPEGRAYLVKNRLIR